MPVCECVCVEWVMPDQTQHRGWRRVMGCLLLLGHFPQKRPKINGSFAERDLHLRRPMHLCHPVEGNLFRVYVLYVEYVDST